MLVVHTKTEEASITELFHHWSIKTEKEHSNNDFLIGQYSSFTKTIKQSLYSMHSFFLRHPLIQVDQVWVEVNNSNNIFLRLLNWVARLGMDTHIKTWRVFRTSDGKTKDTWIADKRKRSCKILFIWSSRITGHKWDVYPIEIFISATNAPKP